GVMAESYDKLPLGEPGIKPGAAPAEAPVARSAVPSREVAPRRSRLERRPGALDLGDAHVLGEEVRRHQREPAHAVVLDAAGVNRRNRCSVAVADEKATAEADRVEHASKHVARLVVHERDRTRQFRRRRAAVAGARISEYSGAGGCG